MYKQGIFCYDVFMEFCRDWYLANLQKMIDQPSPSGDYLGANKMVNMIKEFLPEAKHLSTNSSSPGYFDDHWFSFAGTGTGDLLFLGHVDTIGPLHLPFHIKDDKVFGRGTYDMKAGVLMALLLMQNLAKKPHLFSSLTLLISCDEETRRSPLQISKDIGWDAVLGFEGGSMNKQGYPELVVERVGSYQLSVNAHGQAAHSGVAPEHGKSALQALVKLVGIINQQTAKDVSLHPVQISSGEHENMIPDRGWLLYDVRSTEHLLLSDFDIPPEIDGVVLTPNFLMRYPPMKKKDKSWQVVLDLLQKGLEVRSVSRKGSGDINFFAEHAPVLIDGLGPFCEGPDPSHSMHEHILISSLETCYNLGKEVILDILERIPERKID